jgi:hypothetical protein
MIRFTLVLYSLFLLVVCPIKGQTTQQELFECIEKTGGVYYAYPGGKATLTPTPENYQPFYISHFGRHGSRYLISDQDYKCVMDVLLKAKKENALSSDGTLALQRLQKIWPEVKLRGGDLTPIGRQQQREIAERMVKHYPSVFIPSAQLTARATTVMRCALTMDAFCERIKETHPHLFIDRDASNRNMGYLNFHTKAACAFNAEKGPWRLQYKKFEERHTQPERMMKQLFVSADFVERCVDPAQLMWGFYWIASDMQDIKTPQDFYFLFQKQELFDLWQCVNYRFYVGDANSALSKGIMLENAKPSLQHIVDSADKYIKKKQHGATLRFAHDGNVIPLAALMHINNCAVAVAEPSSFYKHWSDFKIVPMAGNIQLIFYSAPHKNILVKCLLNEEEAKFPIETTHFPYYKWKDLKAFFLKRIKK